MALSGFKSTNHPQQTDVRGPVDDRATPPGLWAELNARFGFTVDVAAAAHNAKCDRYYDRERDGLLQPWDGEVVWCNPPYSDIAPWIRKAWSESAVATVVMLLPANRTEQSWWQQTVEPFRDRAGSPLRVEFIAGRLRFLKPGQSMFEENRPPFGCCLLIWQTSAWAPDRIQGGLFGEVG